MDAVKPSLHTPYTGPHEVLSRGEKTFSIRVNGNTVRVSIDRLKPAHLIREDLPLAASPTTRAVISTPNEVVQPAATRPDEVVQPATTRPEQERQTRSGQRVHFPKKYLEYF